MRTTFRMCEDPDDDNDGVLDDAPDNCPLVPNDDQAEDRVSINGILLNDSDTVGDACDVDLDNDGLIEIKSLEDLDYIRHALQGHSYNNGSTSSTAGAPTANSSDVVCNEAATDGVWLCGYELVNDLNFDTNGDGSITADDNAISWGGGSGWRPIGSLNKAFIGILEGNGYTIANLYINLGESDSDVGLFGYIDLNGEVRNLTLSNVSLAGGKYVGGLVGTLSNSTISNSSSSGNVVGVSNVGGLVGESTGSNSMIRDSHSNSIVTWNSLSGSSRSPGFGFGGLVGINRGTIVASSSIGSVTGQDYVGGLVGQNSNGTISNSSSSSNVTSEFFAIFGGFGGLVGINTTESAISNSSSSGNVSGTENVGNVGGLVGINDGTIITSYSIGSVNASDRVGGLVGSNGDPILSASSGTISNSYSSGSVEGSNDVGGLVGSNTFISNTISNSFSSGNVSGGDGTGGLVGLNDGTISNSSSSSNVNDTGTGILGDFGGLVGFSSGLIIASYSSGIVTIEFSSSITPLMGIGGLVGTNNGRIRACYSNSSVIGDESNDVGGLVGSNGNFIIASYSSGMVTGDMRVGGLVGNNDANIAVSYSKSSVVGSGNVGGLVGRHSNGGFIVASYSSGSVVGATNIGGLVGENDNDMSTAIVTSYWIDEGTIGGVAARLFGIGNDDTSNDNVDDTGENNRLMMQGLNTSQMRAQPDTDGTCPTGTCPDFSNASNIVPGTLVTNLPTGNFSAAWKYEADCYPRLKIWTSGGLDNAPGHK